jgi:AcrR family transcriptional regulator
MRPIVANPETFEREMDGRRLRRLQNREAVLVALGELFRDGIYQPSAAEIADRAGLSPRSLFRYFDDIDDLTRAAIERELAAALPMVEPAVEPDAPLAVRIERLVAARVRLFEATAPAARAARASAYRNPVLAGQVHRARSFMRAQIVTLFGGDVGPELLAAIDALCSFETYELLRVDQGLSKARTTAALSHALTTLTGGQG